MCSSDLASNQNCARTAHSNVMFITNVSPASGNGDANVSYTVAPNTSASPRSGTLTIAGQILTVNQSQSTATHTTGSGSTTGSGFPSLSVNGHKLSSTEDRWVRFIANQVVPQLSGDRRQQIRVASVATWWSLKEGVLDTPNPISYSNCGSSNSRLGPLGVCPSGKVWQVGLAGVQVPNFRDSDVLNAINGLWPGRSITDVLTEAVKFAGFSRNADPGAAIIASSGDLRKSWLLRDPTIGLTLVERNVVNECINGSKSWCYGTAWSQTNKYAPNRSAAMQSISDLTAIFEAITPTPTTTPPVVALVPTVTRLSPTTMIADGLDHPLTIYGSNFQSGNVVQFKWTSGNRANVWNVARSAPVINSGRITLGMYPGTLSNIFYVRVCRSQAQATVSDCSSGLQYVTANPPVSVFVPTVTRLSPTTMVADGLAHTLTIYGSNFQSGSVVQFKWTSGNRANVWNVARSAPVISSGRITLGMHPGTLSNIFYVRVCRSQAQATVSDCSSGLQYVTANSPVAVLVPALNSTYYRHLVVRWRS